MLDTSWKATGLVRPAWHRLDAPKGRRELLADLTGIPAPNLSGMNTGRIPMTMEMARRIADVVPGLSVQELGAPAEGDGVPRVRRLPRLEELATDLAELVRTVTRLQERVSKLEARPWPGEAQSTDP